MGIIFDISTRNLMRQKRRNILLGIAIAFGMMVLVVSNSFSHGISDALLNRIVVYVAGHMEVALIEEGKVRFPIIRDKDRFMQVITKNVTGIKQINENLAVFTRGIGNGKSDNIILIGARPDPEFYSYVKTITGNAADMVSDKYHNPIIINTGKTKSLNVKLYDVIRVRLQTVNGQQQTDTLTVVAISESQNMFMDFALFISQPNIKKLIGMKPHETGGLQIILDQPTSAVKKADILHGVLTPNIAAIFGDLRRSGGQVSAVMMPFYRDPVLLTALIGNLTIVSGNRRDAYGKEGVLLSAPLAAALNVRPGDKLTFSYKNKFVYDRAATTSVDLTVKAIYTTSVNIPVSTILVSEDLFYRNYYRNLPPDLISAQLAVLPTTGSPLYSLLGKEWNLLPRTATSEDYMKKFKKLIEKRSAVSALDVRTMYETASNVLQMEKVLNLITLIAVMILFFIILIGVVNTLRMTIRERTREIGTVRAIGMQSRDVRNIFMLETLLLTFIACTVGILVGFALMWLLTFIKFDTGNMLSIILVDRHLNFVPTALGITGNFALIMLIAAVTSFFPARRAARLLPSAALRQYE